jgi:hypothetical protein
MTFQYARRRGCPVEGPNPFVYDYTLAKTRWTRRYLGAVVIERWQITQRLAEIDPWAAKYFIEEITKYQRDEVDQWILRYHARSLFVQLGVAFTFDSTPQGWKYWNSIRQQLVK